MHDLHLEVRLGADLEVEVGLEDDRGKYELNKNLRPYITELNLGQKREKCLTRKKCRRKKNRMATVFEIVRSTILRRTTATKVEDQKSEKRKIDMGDSSLTRLRYSFENAQT